MPRNAFTDESRDARLKLSVDGFCDTLRAPESLRALFMEHKPAVQSVGDFALMAMLNHVISQQASLGDYRAIQRLLGTLFGEVVPDGTSPRKPGAKVTGGTNGAERHSAERRSA